MSSFLVNSDCNEQRISEVEQSSPRIAVTNALSIHRMQSCEEDALFGRAICER